LRQLNQNNMNILPKTITDRVSIKNVKENFGHDLCGFFCDIYFDNKKVGYLNNDGWGGCPDIQTYGYDDKSKALMKSFENFLTEQNFAQFQADDYNKPHPQMPSGKNDWKVSDFTFDNQVEFICERLNFLKSIERQTKKAILYGNPRSSNYKILSWKGVKTLDEVVASIGTARFKTIVEGVKAKLVEGEMIYNTNLEKYLR
jgi:hypothetical protein